MANLETRQLIPGLMPKDRKWEATRKITESAWLVAYGKTEKSALKKLDEITPRRMK